MSSPTSTLPSSRCTWAQGWRENQPGCWKHLDVHTCSGGNARDQLSMWEDKGAYFTLRPARLDCAVQEVGQLPPSLAPLLH